jgi:ABC-2 type transport system ATP-binding protein
LTAALERRGHRVDRDGDVLNVFGATPEEVGEIASDDHLAVLGLAPRTRSLEEAFISLTGVQS